MDRSRETWGIHKFGGTSLVDATCCRAVLKILAAGTFSRRIVVVSAMGKVTDELIALADLAGKRPDIPALHR